MSSLSTTVPSLAQMYCCFRREPQALCSILNEMALADCVAVYILTGIDTSPNDSVSEPIARAAMLPFSLDPPVSFVLEPRRRWQDLVCSAVDHATDHRCFPSAESHYRC